MFPGVFQFADFELDGNVYELRRNGNPLKLERIPLDLLFLLVDQRNRLVTREEILERLWVKGVFFDVDNAINSAVRKLRRALGDNPEAPRFVLTVPSKGYRFIADVCEESLAAANPPSSTQPAAAAPRKSDESQIRQADTSAPENLEGERKTVTVLLVDFKGSTRLVEDLDPEEARAIVDPALKLMIDVVHQYGGYITRSTDDGIFAMFGAPIAHEDHPQRALSAALRMQAELKRYAEKLRAEKGVTMQVRAGAHTGEVVVREIRTGEKHTEYGPIGPSTSVAAHLQMMAAPGSVAITESMRKLVEGYFTLKSLGPARINGGSEPLEIYEVTGPGPLRTRFQRAAARGYTKFVGRQREIETLKHAAESAQAGRGQIVATVAEPGLGKSRLLFEFKATAQSGWLRLEALSVSHGKGTAYLPVIELLHSYFGITAEDDQRTRRDKVNGRILTLDPALEDTRPYLFGLLGLIEGEDPLARMDGQIRRRRTQEAIKRILLRESLNQPLMLVFEDLHWIDEQTQEFLNLLADSLANAKLLLLVNYRPEYSHQWGSKTYYTQLRLDPLGTESADEMLSALFGESPDLGPVKKLIIERTEGNPFFMEEMYQSMLEDGVIARNGAVKLVKPLQSARLPTTMQGLLAARIDRLSADAKQLLQTLSVIGREFPLSLIRAVLTRSDDELNRMLNDLQLGEFIYEQPALGDTEFVFKHALTQEVAYNSLLIERRKILHERAGQALEAMFAEHLDDHLAELARHYSRSNNTRKAVDFLSRAGQQALQRSASADAISRLNAAIDLLQRLPDTPERAQQQLTLEILLGPALIAIRGNAAPQVQKTYEQALDLCRRYGRGSQLFQVLFGLRSVYLVKGRLQEAHRLGEQLLGLANGLSDTGLLLESHLALGNTFFSRGEHIPAQAHMEQGIALYDPQRHRSHAVSYGVDPGLMCLAFLARVHWVLGRIDQARKTAQRVMELAQDLSHSFSLAYSFIFAATLSQFLGDAAATYKWAETGIALSNEQGFPAYVGIGNIFAGWALSEQGQTDQGLERMNQGLKSLQDTGARLWSPTYLTWMAEVHVKMGKVEEGLGLLREAQALIDETSERLWESEVYRLLGELTLQKFEVPTCKWSPALHPAAQSEAEACFRKAIEIARSQQAKSLELRSVMSLSRLWHRCGEKKMAYELLAEIYGWFTEGLDTPDLREASSLLQELA
jgi:class 3 adenylate cyclase/predicted ATPase